MSKLKRVTDSVKIEGWVEVIVKDKNGNVKFHAGAPLEKHVENIGENNSSTSKPASLKHRLKNIMTNVGLACVIRLMFTGLTEDKFGYLGIGTGTASEAATDTSLQLEVARKAATATQMTTSITDDTARLEASFSKYDGLSGTMTITETGIFNMPSGGEMLARKLVTPATVNWDGGDMLTIRYYVQMAR